MKQQNRRIYKFDEFQIDVLNRQLRRGDTPVVMPAKAFDLLLALVENKGRLIEKDELFSRVWNDQIVEESNLTVHVSQIRKALGEKRQNPRYIETVPGYGYRFVGDVENFDDDDLIFETQTLSRIVIEKEENEDAAEARKDIDAAIEEPQTRGKNLSSLLNASASLRRSLSASTLAAYGGFVVLLALAFGTYRYFEVERANAPFEKIKLARLTNSGKVSGATISPDGKYIAYILGESEGNSLRMQQVGTANNVRLLPPVKAQIYELTFTPDGSHIFYNLFTDGRADPEFYRISSLGGVSERIPNVVASYISFSPDGKRFAYAQSDSAAGRNYLKIADADGTNQQTIAAKNHPHTFETQVPVVAWSPDGETIACLVNHFEPDASYSSIIGINVRDGSEKPLSEQRWYDVFSIEWSKKGSGLLISASDKVSGSNQVRFLSYPQGESRKITNDLSQYDSLSATADGESFVAIQTDAINSILVGEAGTNDFKEITTETGALFPLVWTPDGKIIFRSARDGVSNLWTMDANGGNQRQLTINAQVDSRGMCLSPDGKRLVFGSWRNGKSNLWRIDADGSNLTQLTDGEVDVYPSCSPDNQTVIYQRGLHSNQRLWKVPLAGGEPVQLTDSYSKWAAISNDGNRLSYFFMANNKWRLGIISPEGGSMLQSLDVPATLKENVVRWSPDNQSLFYISTVGSVGNIRSLPLDASESKPLTHFESHSIDSFAFSPVNKKLAIARSLTVSDVVLITNEVSR